MHRFPWRRTGTALLAAVVAGLAVGPAAPRTIQAATTPTVAAPGYQVTVFAQGSSAYSNPDSLTLGGRHVYVGYQNVTAKDGSDNQASTVVEYTLRGTVVHTFSVLGHCDGLRYNPYTQQSPMALRGHPRA